MNSLIIFDKTIFFLFQHFVILSMVYVVFKMIQLQILIGIKTKEKPQVLALDLLSTTHYRQTKVSNEWGNILAAERSAFCFEQHCLSICLPKMTLKFNSFTTEVPVIWKPVH